MNKTKKKTLKFAPDVVVAAEEYVARLEKRSRPRGKLNEKGGWEPHAWEACDCCIGIGDYSSFPYTVLQHCKSAGHVACLYRVDEKQLRKAAKIIKAGGKVAVMDIAEMVDEMKRREKADSWSLERTLREGARALERWESDREEREQEYLQEMEARYIAMMELEEPEELDI